MWSLWTLHPTITHSSSHITACDVTQVHPSPLSRTGFNRRDNASSELIFTAVSKIALQGLECSSLPVVFVTLPLCSLMAEPAGLTMSVKGVTCGSCLQSRSTPRFPVPASKQKGSRKLGHYTLYTCCSICENRYSESGLHTQCVAKVTGRKRGEERTETTDQVGYTIRRV